MALADLATLKTYMGIDSSITTQDARLTVILARIDAWVKKTSRDAGVILEEETVTDTLDGPGSHRLFLSYRPIISVTAVYHSEAVPRVFDSTALVAANQYLLHPDIGMIETPNAFGHHHHHGHRGVFLRGVQNYQAVYAAGYASIPGDLVAGVIMVSAAFAAGRPGKDGMQSERLGDYSYVRAKVMELPGVEGFLAPYVIRPSAF